MNYFDCNVLWIHQKPPFLISIARWDDANERAVLHTIAYFAILVSFIYSHHQKNVVKFFKKPNGISVWTNTME